MEFGFEGDSNYPVRMVIHESLNHAVFVILHSICGHLSGGCFDVL